MRQSEIETAATLCVPTGAGSLADEQARLSLWALEPERACTGFLEGWPATPSRHGEAKQAGVEQRDRRRLGYDFGDRP